MNLDEDEISTLPSLHRYDYGYLNFNKIFYCSRDGYRVWKTLLGDSTIMHFK